MTITNASELERQAAVKQTLADKQAVWTNFLSRIRGGKPANTINNFTFLMSALEKSGKLVTPENLHKVLLENIDYLPDGYDRSAEVAAQQSAARQAQAEETRKLNAWFENAQAQYGFVDDGHNRNLLVEYLTLHFHGVPSEIALTAFIRENADNPNVHRLAQPAAAKALTPDEMWARQNAARVANPAKEREERLAAAAEKKKRFDQDMISAKIRASFLADVKTIRTHREMAPQGIDWAKSWSAQKQLYEKLKTKYDASFAPEIDAAIAKVGR